MAEMETEECVRDRFLGILMGIWGGNFFYLRRKVSMGIT